MWINLTSCLPIGCCNVSHLWILLIEFYKFVGKKSVKMEIICHFFFFVMRVFLLESLAVAKVGICSSKSYSESIFAIVLNKLRYKFLTKVFQTFCRWRILLASNRICGLVTVTVVWRLGAQFFICLSRNASEALRDEGKNLAKETSSGIQFCRRNIYDSSTDRRHSFVLSRIISNIVTNVVLYILW